MQTQKKHEKQEKGQRRINVSLIKMFFYRADATFTLYSILVVCSFLGLARCRFVYNRRNMKVPNVLAEPLEQLQQARILTARLSAASDFGQPLWSSRIVQVELLELSS
jgi:hypothetical protein